MPQGGAQVHRLIQGGVHTGGYRGGCTGGRGGLNHNKAILVVHSAIIGGFLGLFECLIRGGKKMIVTYKSIIIVILIMYLWK